MGLQNSFPFLPVQAAPAAFSITNSAAFALENFSKLQITASASTSNDTLFTTSLWCKRSSVSNGGFCPLVGISSNDLSYVVFGFDGSDRLAFISVDSSGVDLIRLESNATFTDVSEWYHLLISYDSAQNTNTDRLKIYVNGVLFSDWSAQLYPALDSPVGAGGFFSSNANDNTIGWGTVSSSDEHFNGLISEFYHIDGGLQAVSDFTEVDAITDQLNPTEFNSSFGSNGFQLQFKNSGSLGFDSSGSGNSLAQTNLLQSSDTPIENCCTLMVTDIRTVGNISGSGSTTDGGATVTFRPNAGQWYYEKDGVGVTYDADVNGVFDPILVAGVYVFAEGDLVGSIPANHLALMSKNLPLPDVVKSKENFKPIIYDDGAGAKTVGFQPNMLWFKARGVNQSHKLVDSVRGVSATLAPNSTSNELTEPTGVLSFDANGFTVGSLSAVSNQSGVGMLALCWIANVTNGVEVISFTGDGNSNRKIAHTLGAEPQMMFVKSRNTTGTNPWRVYHKDVDSAAPEDFNLKMHTTSSRENNFNIWNDMPPDNVEFTVGVNNTVNQAGFDYLAILMTPVEGFSDFNSFVGNSLSEGQFVYTGFRPAFILIKSSDAVASWMMLDCARSPYNEADELLAANATTIESGFGSDNRNVDILSNGFKVKNTIAGGVTDLNAVGVTYVTMAFAEAPFQYSRGR